MDYPYEIFEATNKVERKFKEEKVPKYKGISSSNSWKKEQGRNSNIFWLEQE